MRIHPRGEIAEFPGGGDMGCFTVTKRDAPGGPTMADDRTRLEVAPVIYESQEDLDRSLARWQRILRLQDWNVTAEVVRDRRMPAEGASGHCCMCFPRKSADISICSAHDLDECDHEQTLVHELIHLHIEPFFRELNTEPNDPLHVLMEQCVDRLAGAFVALDRRVHA